MEGGILSIIGLGFLLLAFWRAIRVRHDLASGETRWETALFGRKGPIRHEETPVKFWCAIVVHVIVVILFALVAAAAFRATSLRRL